MNLVLLISLILLALYWLKIRNHVKVWERANTIDSRNDARNMEIDGVSVVIVSKNEYESLSALLPMIFAQQIDIDFEVILIDDQSNDQTSALPTKFKTLRYVDFQPKTMASKKEAIEHAVNMARFEAIVQIDADCCVGGQWLEEMAKCFHPGTSMVLGPLQYNKGHSIFSKLLELEMFSLTGLCGSGVSLQKPFLSNAANMAYLKAVFKQLDPYQDKSIASGDDSFLVDSMVGSNRCVDYCFSKKAVVLTNAPSSFNSFVQQRLRWASKVSINKRTPMDAKVFFLLNIWVAFLLFLTLVNFEPYIFLLMLIIALKLLLDMWFFRVVLHFFGRMNMILWTPILTLIYPVYLSLFSIFSKFVPYTWKGKKYKSWKK
jgi:cellulose synthase/poly-beta-1,6-N-acetylglucosamine synthase-like glycosyltransferase